jgi:uncharacterized protein YgiM (DUF1202 family)
MSKRANIVLVLVGLGVIYSNYLKKSDVALPPVNVEASSTTNEKKETVVVKDETKIAEVIITPTAVQNFISTPAPKISYLSTNVDTLNVRTTADPKGVLAFKIKKNTLVKVVEVRGGWSKIEVNGKTGYVTSLYLSNPVTKEKKRFRVIESSPKEKLAPEVSNSEIVKAIIRASIGSYSGRCPCPYFSDRAGRSCGRRSAYSRAGGASPLCYPQDVTGEMIGNWKSNH